MSPHPGTLLAIQLAGHVSGGHVEAHDRGSVGAPASIKERSALLRRSFLGGVLQADTAKVKTRTRWPSRAPKRSSCCARFTNRLQWMLQLAPSPKPNSKGLEPMNAHGTGPDPGRGSLCVVSVSGQKRRKHLKFFGRLKTRLKTLFPLPTPNASGLASHPTCSVSTRTLKA